MDFHSTFTTLSTSTRTAIVIRSGVAQFGVERTAADTWTLPGKAMSWPAEVHLDAIDQFRALLREIVDSEFTSVPDFGSPLPSLAVVNPEFSSSRLREGDCIAGMDCLDGRELRAGHRIRAATRNLLNR